MAFFSKQQSSSPPSDPSASSSEVDGNAHADIHTMPGKFLAQEKKISWFRRRITIGMLIIVVAGGGMGLAAWLFVRSLALPDNPAPPSPGSPPPLVVSPAPQKELQDNTPPAQEPPPPPAPAPEVPVVPVPEPIPAPPLAEEPFLPPVLPLSRDSDGDGMTDAEEALWGTDPGKPDTDADGYLDGQELFALFDPSRGGEASLDQSAQARIYANPQLPYTMLVPASWENRLIDPTTSMQTLFAASTGEFVSVIAEQNVRGYSSARDWYINEYGAANPDALQTIATASLNGILSADGLAAYFIDGGYLYAISYNPGIRDSINFKATYSMMVQSFKTFSAP